MADRTLEWPPGSGWRATYNAEELELVRGIYELARTGRIPVKQAQRELNVIHGLKAVLDARVVA